MKNHISILVLVCAFVVTLGVRLNAATEQDIYRVLKERGIRYDTNTLRQAVVEGVLKAVDKRAYIVPAKQSDGTVSRETIATNEAWSEGICYIKLNGLYEGGGTQIVAQLREWSLNGKSGIVMDLREADGNSLDTVDYVASLFPGTNTALYSLKNGNGRILDTHNVKTNAAPAIPLPVALLINGETRDAAELLAALMKARRSVMLVGLNTKGDNAVREMIPLPGNTEELYLATKWVVLPDGQAYNKNGVQPDVIVQPSNTNTTQTAMPDDNRWGKPLSDKTKTDRVLMHRVSGDATLLRATDILLGLKVLRSDETGETDESTNTQDPEQE